MNTLTHPNLTAIEVILTLTNAQAFQAAEDKAAFIGDLLIFEADVYPRPNTVSDLLQARFQALNELFDATA